MCWQLSQHLPQFVIHFSTKNFFKNLWMICFNFHVYWILSKEHIAVNVLSLQREMPLNKYFGVIVLRNKFEIKFSDEITLVNIQIICFCSTYHTSNCHCNYLPIWKYLQKLLVQYPVESIRFSVFVSPLNWHEWMRQREMYHAARCQTVFHKHNDPFEYLLWSIKSNVLVKCCCRCWNANANNEDEKRQRLSSLRSLDLVCLFFFQFPSSL